MTDESKKRTPRFVGVDAILLVGLGFVIRPILDAIERRDWIALVAGVAYVAIAMRRVYPRLPSLSDRT